MNRKTKGRLAEAKVLAYFIENEYEVYVPFSGISKYDFVIVKDGLTQRVSVKYTSVRKESGTWVVEMRQISRRNHCLNIDKFDCKQFDIVAVYIGPKDKVVLVAASEVKPRGLYLKNSYVDKGGIT